MPLKSLKKTKGGNPIQRHLDLIAKQVVDNKKPFFVACDNSSVQNDLRSKYPNLIFLDKWFAASGEPLHLSEGCPDKLENAKAALIDIILLANASTLIYNSRSCFSQCAQYFSPHEQQIILSILPDSKLRQFINKLGKHLNKILRRP